jgi:hypothetical protein
MKVWLSFLDSFNGKAYFLESEWSDNETLELYTDSAGSETMGGSGFFSKECVTWSIAIARLVFSE